MQDTILAHFKAICLHELTLIVLQRWISALLKVTLPLCSLLLYVFHSLAL